MANDRIKIPSKKDTFLDALRNGRDAFILAAILVGARNGTENILHWDPVSRADRLGQQVQQSFSVNGDMPNNRNVDLPSNLFTPAQFDAAMKEVVRGSGEMPWDKYSVSDINNPKDWTYNLNDHYHTYNFLYDIFFKSPPGSVSKGLKIMADNGVKFGSDDLDSIKYFQRETEKTWVGSEGDLEQNLKYMRECVQQIDAALKPLSDQHRKESGVGEKNSDVEIPGIIISRRLSDISTNKPLNEVAHELGSIADTYFGITSSKLHSSDFYSNDFAYIHEDLDRINKYIERAQIRFDNLKRQHEAMMKDLDASATWMKGYIAQHGEPPNKNAHTYEEMATIVGLGFAAPFAKRKIKLDARGREQRAEEEIKERGSREDARIVKACMTHAGKALCGELSKKGIDTIGELEKKLEENPVVVVELFATALKSGRPAVVASIADVIEAMDALKCPFEKLGISEPIRENMDIEVVTKIILESLKDFSAKYFPHDDWNEWKLTDAIAHLERQHSSSIPFSEAELEKAREELNAGNGNGKGKGRK